MSTKPLPTTEAWSPSSWLACAALHQPEWPDQGRVHLTLCDPRLNPRQSLDLAFRVAELMRRYPSSR